MKKQQSRWLMGLAAILGVAAVFNGALASSAFAQSRLDRAINPEQVPTARYGRGESIDLSLIIEEWRARYPATPVFACTCMSSACNRTEQWPFREYAQYQPLVALGDFNAASNESAGFNCFDIETGDRPES